MLIAAFMLMLLSSPFSLDISSAAMIPLMSLVKTRLKSWLLVALTEFSEKNMTEIFVGAEKVVAIIKLSY